MRASRILYIVAAVALFSESASAAILTENFPDPLGGFYSRWLGANTNMGSVYYAQGSSSDIDDRGNNPEGLWVADSQVFGGGTFGPTLEISFNPVFGATLTSLTFGVEAFVAQRISVFDSSNSLLFSGDYSGGGFDLDHIDLVVATSTNGIGRILFDSTPFGSGQISGNTSVDNFVAVTNDVAEIPEPGSLTLLSLGAIGLAGAARRRRQAV